MPTLTNDELTIALGVVALFALLALIVMSALLVRLRRLRREYAVLRGDGREVDILAVVRRAIDRIESQGQRIETLASAQTVDADRGRLALQRLGLVRYDAFEDMGGRLSFSAAILDDHGDGIVITTINGRTEARTYAKPIKNLASTHNLSDEERAAIADAIEDRSRPHASVSS